MNQGHNSIVYVFISVLHSRSHAYQLLSTLTLRRRTSLIFCVTADVIMAEAHVSVQPFRPVFLAVPGVPPIPWSRWRRMFEDYLLAAGVPETAAFGPRKAALLHSSLGRFLVTRPRVHEDPGPRGPGFTKPRVHEAPGS